MAGLHGIVLPTVIASRLPTLGAGLVQFGVSFAPASLPGLLALYAWMAVLLAVALVPPNILQLLQTYEPAITMPVPYAKDPRMAPLRSVFARLAWQPNAGWAVTVAAMSLLGILSLNQVTEFLYWQF